MQRSASWLLLIVALAGVGLGLSLTHKQVDARTGRGFQASSLLCGEDGGCEAVNTHERARIAVGTLEPIPVALPAFGFFGMVAILALLAALGGPEQRQARLAVVALCSTPALVFCLYLFLVQAVVIGALCTYCILLDGVTLATAILAVVGHGGGLRALLGSARRPPVGLLAAAVIGMLILDGGLYAAYGSWVDAAGGPAPQRRLSGDAHSDHDGHGHEHADNPKSEAEALEEARKAVADFLDSYPGIDPVDLPDNPFDGFKGNPDAPVVVVEYADFECPHCRLAGYFMKDIAHRYGDRIGLSFKNYPLGKACNEGLGRDVHPDACEAAVGVQCAGRQRQFWPFHDLAFDNQGDLGTRTLLRIARELGLDEQAFEECLENEAVWDNVRTQVAQGRARGVRGTPTFFVNGKELPTAHPVFVEAAIRHELRALGDKDLPEDVDGLFPP